MKYQVIYGSFVKHRVSCESNAQVEYCKQQLKARGISCEIIDISKLSLKDKKSLCKSDFSFQRFKKEVLK